MSLKPKSKISTEFNMSSMTDIIFLLLIFFVITSTVVKEPVLKVLLPKGAKQTPITAPINVSVDVNLNYAVGPKKVAYEDLQNALQTELNQKPDAVVSVHADKRVEYDKVMEIVRMADKMNAKVVLALEK